MVCTAATGNHSNSIATTIPKEMSILVDTITFTCFFDFFFDRGSKGISVLIRVKDYLTSEDIVCVCLLSLILTIPV